MVVKDKISIILPCYNVEKYIGRCLKSIENQTYDINNLEVILIDDASSDNTRGILEAFRDRNSRNVLLIKHNKNKGASFSRNEGLDFSNGKYIMFVDGDDMLDENICEKMYSKAEEYDCDLVECGYKLFAEVRDAVSERIGKDWLKDLSIDDNLKWYLVRVPKMAVWGRLYRKAFLDQNQLRFNPEFYLGEDINFTGISVFCLKKYYFLSEKLYFYFYNQEGMLRSKGYMSSRNRLMEDIAEDIFEKLKKRNLYERAYVKCHDEFGWFLMGFIYFGNIGKLYGEIGRYKQALLSTFPDILENKWLQNVDERHEKYLYFLRR